MPCKTSDRCCLCSNLQSSESGLNTARESNQDSLEKGIEEALRYAESSEQPGAVWLATGAAQR